MIKTSAKKHTFAGLRLAVPIMERRAFFIINADVISRTHMDTLSFCEASHVWVTLDGLFFFGRIS